MRKDENDNHKEIPADGWVTVPGAARYEAHVGRGLLRNIRTGRLIRPTRTDDSYNLSTDRGRKKVKRCLLFYSVQHGIRPYGHGRRICAYRDGDSYRAMLADDCRSVLRREKRQGGGVDKADLLRRIEKARQTIGALRRYYETGDGAELARIFDEEREKVVRYLRRTFRMSEASCEELSRAAMDLTIRAVQEGTLVYGPYTYMRKTARSIIAKERAARRRITVYSDQKKYEEL